MKHTPGPWTVRDAKYIKGVVSEMRFVVECDTNIPQNKGTVALAGYKPNANLIAAAPDLLEACKSLVLYHKSLKNSNVPDSVINTLHQVIKKAEAK